MHTILTNVKVAGPCTKREGSGAAPTPPSPFRSSYPNAVWIPGAKHTCIEALAQSKIDLTLKHYRCCAANSLNNSNLFCLDETTKNDSTLEARSVELTCVCSVESLTTTPCTASHTENVMCEAPCWSTLQPTSEPFLFGLAAGIGHKLLSDSPSEERSQRCASRPLDLCSGDPNKPMTHLSLLPDVVYSRVPGTKPVREKRRRRCAANPSLPVPEALP